MKKGLWVIAALVTVALLLRRGAESNPDKASFTGEWSYMTDGGPVRALAARKTVEVAADRGRFRVSEITASADGKSASTTTYVYDGKTLHQKTRGPQPFFNREDAREISEQKAAPLRFWARRVSVLYKLIPKEKELAAPVAGRSTVLHEIIAGDPYSEQVTVRKWIDAETGVVLKSEESYLNKYQETALTAWECRRIEYKRPPKELFQKP
jgi:hypothetical protein